MEQWVIFISILITPLIMILGGLHMRKGGPKKINMFFGYRTRMSMKSEETWRFAHICCGNLWFFYGSVLLFFSSAAGFFISRGTFANWSETVLIIVIVAQVVVMTVPIVTVEKRLRRHFDENGDPRIR